MIHKKLVYSSKKTEPTTNKKAPHWDSTLPLFMQ